MNYLNTLLFHSLSPLVAYIGIFLVLFAESGLLIGFFLPGDSLVFPLGLLAAQGHFSLPILILICIAGAVICDSCGYVIGRKLGPRIFQKDDSLFFKGEYVERARMFFERYGKMTLFLARFTPVIRTFAPTMAGVGRMNYRTFLTYNVLGGTAWSVALLLLGYFLGRIIPNIDHYLLPIIVAIIVVSLIGPVKQILDHRRASAHK